MKAYILIICLMILFSLEAFSQCDSIKNEKNYFTKQWVDSMNEVSLSQFNPVAPNMINWYDYDGQIQHLPLPSNVVNIIRIKLKEECVEE